MTAQEVLAIAKKEIGYCEKKSNSQLDDKTANAGSNNYTKYARDLYKAGYWNGNKNGYDWCTTFVAWCFWMAAGKNKDKATEVQPYGSLGASCKYQTTYYQQFLRWSYTPHVGDQAFFARGHTGLVESYDGKTMFLIEGNSNNKVERRAYSFPNSKFTGFGRPYYKEEVAPSIPKEEPKQILHTVVSTDTPEKIARKYGITPAELLAANKKKYPTITIDFIRDGWQLIIPVSFVAYTGKVTSENGLNIREGNNISYKKIGVLKLNQTVTILEEKSGWGRINYNGKDGWICLNWIKKV